MIRLLDRIVPRSALEWGRLTSGQCYSQKIVEYPQIISVVLPWDVDSIRVGGVLHQARAVDRFDQWAS